MNFKRTTQYALVAISQLDYGRGTRPIPCSELCIKGKMPPRFLLQVMNELVKGGLVTSTRGVLGGYRLARRKADISLADVVWITEGPAEARASEVIARALPKQAAGKIDQVLAACTAAVTGQLRTISITALG
jgi:Rrf2 family protein